MTSRGPGQRAGLDRAAVLSVAGDLLTERGINGLTMRALADRLGVAPNALYSHVSGKTALLDELADAVLAEVPIPAERAFSDSADIHRALHEVMANSYEALLRHPDLIPVLLTRQGSRGPNAQRLGEAMAPYLQAAGMDDISVALRALIGHTIGFAAFSVSATADDAILDLPAVHQSYHDSLDWLLTGMLSTAATPRTTQT